MHCCSQAGSCSVSCNVLLVSPGQHSLDALDVQSNVLVAVLACTRPAIIRPMTHCLVHMLCMQRETGVWLTRRIMTLPPCLAEGRSAPRPRCACRPAALARRPQICGRMASAADMFQIVSWCMKERSVAARGTGTECMFTHLASKSGQTQAHDHSAACQTSRLSVHILHADDAVVPVCAGTDKGLEAGRRRVPSVACEYILRVPQHAGRDHHLIAATS